jgi:hypothetical protein
MINKFRKLALCSKVGARGGEKNNLEQSSQLEECAVLFLPNFLRILVAVTQEKIYSILLQP